jgi:hypothetical protein
VPGVPETKGVTTIQPAAPVPGARMAPNGKWYVKKNGTYFEVLP